MTFEYAFPQPDVPTVYGRGMTLRDYFAAKAMGSLLSTLALKNLDMTPENAAALAYKRADAMLKAREA